MLRNFILYNVLHQDNPIKLYDGNLTRLNKVYYFAIIFKESYILNTIDLIVIS